MIVRFVWIGSTSLFLKLLMTKVQVTMHYLFCNIPLLCKELPQTDFQQQRQKGLLLKTAWHNMFPHPITVILKLFWLYHWHSNLSVSKYLLSIFFPFTFTFLHTICFFLLSLLFLTLTHCWKTNTKLSPLEKYFISFYESYKKF